MCYGGKGRADDALSPDSDTPESALGASISHRRVAYAGSGIVREELDGQTKAKTR